MNELDGLSLTVIATEQCNIPFGFVWYAFHMFSIYIL